MLLNMRLYTGHEHKGTTAQVGYRERGLYEVLHASLWTGAQPNRATCHCVSMAVMLSVILAVGTHIPVGVTCFRHKLANLFDVHNYVNGQLYAKAYLPGIAAIRLHTHQLHHKQ